MFFLFFIQSGTSIKTRMQNKDESCRWTLSMNNESSEKERSSNHQTRSQQATLREGFVFIHPISTKKFL
jgi:predicted RNA-binding protein with RPS1 domain